jgi:hypothetical protein
MVDASNADLWVPSTKCESCGADAQERANFFDARKSKSVQPVEGVTEYGKAPVAVRVIYGGGSASGVLVKDTVRVGTRSLLEQQFVLVNEAGPDARLFRSWDGVFGIGRKKVSGGEGDAFVDRIETTVAIVPGSTRGDANLFVGDIPATLVDPATIVWTPALEPRGPWLFSASVGGHNVQAAVETGTSYVLVPAHSYLTIVRSLIPDFDTFCGVDRSSGNVVVCDCRVRAGVEPIDFVFSGDSSRHFPIPATDLFEEVDGSCIPQIQQKPETTNIDDPYGLIGAPLLNGTFDRLEQAVGNTFGLSLEDAVDKFFDGFGPISVPDMFKDFFGNDGLFSNVDIPGGQHDTFDEIDDELEDAVEAAKQTFDHSTSEFKETLETEVSSSNTGQGFVSTERVIKTLGDGTRCETDVVRDATGKVVSSKTTATDPRGNIISNHSPVCVGMRVAERRMLRQLQAGRSAAPADLWVIGEVFLRRYAVVFDNLSGRIGVAQPVSAVIASSGKAVVSASPNTELGTIFSLAERGVWSSEAMGSWSLMLVASAMTVFGVVTMVVATRRYTGRTQDSDTEPESAGE